MTTPEPYTDRNGVIHVDAESVSEARAADAANAGREAAQAVTEFSDALRAAHGGPKPEPAKQHRPQRAPIDCAADIMFGLNFYQGRCHLFDLRDLVKPENTARPSDGKPSNVTFAVDDAVVKSIRGNPEDAKVACYIVVVPIEASRRQKPEKKLIVTPQDAAREGIIP